MCIEEYSDKNSSADRVNTGDGCALESSIFHIPRGGVNGVPKVFDCDQTDAICPYAHTYACTLRLIRVITLHLNLFV